MRHTLTMSLLEHMFGEVGLLGFPCKASYDAMWDEIVFNCRDIKDSIGREIQEYRDNKIEKYGTIHNVRIYTNPDNLKVYRELNIDTAVDTPMFLTFNKRFKNFDACGYTPYLLIRDLVNTTISELLSQPEIRSIVLEIVDNHKKIYGNACYKRITDSLRDNYFFNVNEQVQSVI